MLNVNLWFCRGSLEKFCSNPFPASSADFHTLRRNLLETSLQLYRCLMEKETLLRRIEKREKRVLKLGKMHTCIRNESMPSPEYLLRRTHTPRETIPARTVVLSDPFLTVNCISLSFVRYLLGSYPVSLGFPTFEW